MTNSEFLESFNALLLDVKEIKKAQSQLLTLLERVPLTHEPNDHYELDWLSPKQVCQIIGCSEVTLWKFRKNNQIPFSRVNRSIRFKKSDVMRFITQNNSSCS